MDSATIAYRRQAGRALSWRQGMVVENVLLSPGTLSSGAIVTRPPAGVDPRN